MANPYVFGGSAFAYEEITYLNQPYAGLENSLGDSSMAYIDPSLQSPSPVSYANTWATPVQQRPKQAPQSAFFVADVPRHGQALHHAPSRPTLGIHPLPLPSQIRLASPISSTEPSSSGSALSPPADTESYYDNLPRTPSDTALRSPCPATLPLEPYAHAMQFRSMGSNFVNPLDVNPALQSGYCESDYSIVDFSFSQPEYSFDSQAGDYDAEPQRTAPPGSTSQRADPEQMRLVRDESQPSSEYPPLSGAEDMDSDDETTVKRQKDDEIDGDYQPNKRQKTATRKKGRRGTKTIAATASPSSRRTKVRADDPPPSRTLSSSSNLKTSLTCAECKQRNFPSQLDLDAHVRKQHQRPFNCVFDFAGCLSTFASKNEWKRHVLTQHLLLFYWACPEGACARTHSSQGTLSSTPDPNNPHGSIFNRKDLFTQHLKRMHAPKEVKDALADARRSSTSTSSNKTPTPTQTAAIAAWEARVKTLQSTAMHPRCHLPTYMRCPVPGCPAQPFRGHDAWNQRMEHVAKHMDRAARGSEPRVVFGGPGDETLVSWAARADVAIIVPSDREDGGEWVLESPLKRGPGGNVVVTTPAPLREQQGWEGDEIVVMQEEEDDDGGEEDAEGEEDD